ncbi:hypothetical protein E2C01_095204 [Portunus trituberculatus]|uniref:Uncharacterized protein n=1 Tax=Portunus trituberculatus TaxID=210409 RepID=A0A5B7K3L0_PORTR|nr:hypothetical protein [Portunus trituberculatus]
MALAGPRIPLSWATTDAASPTPYLLPVPHSNLTPHRRLPPELHFPVSCLNSPSSQLLLSYVSAFHSDLCSAPPCSTSPPHSHPGATN